MEFPPYLVELACIMSSSSLQQLHKLSLHQQNTIWLNRVTKQFSPMFWWFACLFILGGTIHQLLFPLNTLIVISLAIVPSLIFFIWLIVTTKPEEQEGAAAADKLLEASSLFVSAWELHHSTENSAEKIHGSGKLLLLRAEKMLPEWSLQLKIQPRQYINPISLAALSLAVFGLFFLLMPTHVQTGETLILQSSTPDKSIEQIADPAMALSDLFARSEKNSAEMTDYSTAELSTLKEAISEKAVSKQANNSQSQVQSSENKLSAKHTKNKPSGGLEINQHKSSIDTQQSLSNTRSNEQLSKTPENLTPGISQSEGKKTARQTAGNDIARSSNKTLAKTVTFKQIKLIDISSDIDSQASAFDNTLQGNELIISKPQQTDFQQLNKPGLKNISPGNSGTLLSAEQRLLVGRYFKQINNQLNKPLEKNK